MKVAVAPAGPEDQATVGNLLELYIHDFSEFEGWDVDEHGRFGYRYLEAYWTDPDRFPYLIRANGKIAGFVLVRKLEDDAMSIAEFFVLRAYRRRGVGRTAALAALHEHPGPWSVDVRHSNSPATAFWPAVLGPFSPTVHESSVDGQTRSTYRFSTR